MTGKPKAKANATLPPQPQPTQEDENGGEWLVGSSRKRKAVTKPASPASSSSSSPATPVAEQPKPTAPEAAQPAPKAEPKKSEKPKEKKQPQQTTEAAGTSQKPKEAAKTEKPKEVAKTEKPKEAAKTEKPKEAAKTEKPKEAAKTEKPKEVAKTEKPKEVAKTEKPKEVEKSVEAFNPFKYETPSVRARGSSLTQPKKYHKPEEPFVPWITIILTYFAYAVLYSYGIIRNFFGKWFKPQEYRAPEGFAPLLDDFDHFYTKRLFYRIRDCWDRPICSVPGGRIEVMERVSNDGNKTFKFTGKKINCLNLGSYNYLGFGENKGPVTDSVANSIQKYSVSPCSSRMEYGTTDLHVELEKTVAKFVGKPAAVCYAMGFATNSTTLPVLVSKGDLIISDSLNHRSLVIGARSSHAVIRVFQHNDIEHLESVIRTAILEGQPRTRRPWKRIMIVVEGIYSMEGETLRLADIVEVKKKYKAYLYVDEAHSIGALGKSGRGICEHCGVDPSDVDILMGTFTKSFGSIGGYVAADEDLITYIRSRSFGMLYDTSMSVPTIQQILSAFRVIDEEYLHGPEKSRMTRLKENSNYFREELMRRGFAVGGDHDSPVVPMLLLHPAKISAFSRECLAENLAVVVVGFPATSLILSRARFCVSASHTRAEIDDALAKIDRIGDRLQLKYSH